MIQNATDLNDLTALNGHMNLVLIYGPFASGKLTIGKELQKLTGYRFLEKNAINKAPLQVFPFGTPVFKRITGRLRLDICREAATHLCLHRIAYSSFSSYCLIPGAPLFAMHTLLRCFSNYQLQSSQQMLFCL